MNRRVFFVVAGVVAFFAIAPLVPRWLPVVATAIGRIDLAQIGATLAALADRFTALATAEPWLLPALFATGALIVMVMMMRRSGRRKAAHRAEPAARELSHQPAAAPAPVARAAVTVMPAPLAASSSNLRFVRPAPAPVQPVAEPLPLAAPRVASERRTAVRRLSADGRTVAEIARATRVGQDAVRAMMGTA